MFLDTRILISCGYNKCGYTSKSGVLRLGENTQGSFQKTYVSSQDYFNAMRGGFGVTFIGSIICGTGHFKQLCGGFGQNCNGRIICGAGQANCNHLKIML